MNILYPTGQTRNFYERNMQVVNREYNGSGVAPHGPTTAWTYTCPAGRRAFICSFCGWLVRATAATTAGQADIRFYHYDGAQGAAMCYALENQNTPFQWKYAMGSTGVWLTAGQTFHFDHEDGSTGGTYNIYGSAQILEFDA